MRNAFFMAAVGAALAAGGVPTTINAADTPLGRDVRPDRFDNRKGKGQRNRRGKGKANPPKSRPNMRLVSKRVRRKHRRSA
jgi:hypothetical protein